MQALSEGSSALDYCARFVRPDSRRQGMLHSCSLILKISRGSWSLRPTANSGDLQWSALKKGVTEGPRRACVGDASTRSAVSLAQTGMSASAAGSCRPNFLGPPAAKIRVRRGRGDVPEPRAFRRSGQCLESSATQARVSARCRVSWYSCGMGTDFEPALLQDGNISKAFF